MVVKTNLDHVSQDSLKEINPTGVLVLEDGTRRNVVDHGSLKTIIDDAHIVSEFLNVPIWHAESNKT